MPRKKLGESLRERGKISHQDLEKAIKEQAGNALLLGELLLKRGVVAKEDLIPSLAEVTRTHYVDAQSAPVSAEVLELIPAKVARRYCALPLEREGSRLVVVMARPQDLQALQELAFVSGLAVVARFGFREEIEEAIQKRYEGHEEEPAEANAELLAQVEEANGPDVEFVTATSTQRNLDAIREFQAELKKQTTPAVRLVSTMIAEANAKRASDIHIDPQARGPVVRIRVDGILRDLMAVPARLQDSLVSRIKILADMDIAERRMPQDGRLLVAIGRERRDLRVSTLPTQYGEKVVIRILNSTANLVSFHDLGFWEEQADLLGHLLNIPQGMLLVTGPTGSGKSTTLYASLSSLRSRTLNIITVEDPVEYRLEGVNQVQVNEKAGRTFAATLRSILRQDPNVIMVGEIRDTETAEIALRAAQTGHLVLSTMHTRDSVSAIARLLDLGVPPFLIGATLTGVIAQRLVRRLCECRGEVAASTEFQRGMKAAGIKEVQPKMYIPVGCPKCDNSGYLGRVGVYEMLVFDEALSEAVRTGAGLAEIRRMAQAHGMRSLEEDALLKVKLGLTSLEEAMRVLSFKNVIFGGFKPERGEQLRRS
jgi:type IV pilus assembly protein PilB